MTRKDFCKAYSSFYGEKIDNLEQLKHAVFDGHELFEFAKYLSSREAEDADSSTCAKKNCKAPVYEFGLCFKHHCTSEQDTCC